VDVCVLAILLGDVCGQKQTSHEVFLI